MSSPQPTIFISYASEDRVAARLLRDTLAAAGLDVWYDENELGGGDAWDQKIRRQIRDCDYFMPVISATTERRKEGYFRREWRLAVERTLDMADDVMFLLPVCLDDTDEFHARVPEKFMAVQWLRVPGGASTPALDALCRRLAAGDHAVPPVLAKASGAKRPTRDKARADDGKHHDGPPPMPPFPHLAEKASFGHTLKFLAEVLWWAISAWWLLMRRVPLPRWLRIIISIWILFWILSRCSSNNAPSPDRSNRPTKEQSAAAKEAADAKKAEVSKAVQSTLDKISKLGPPSERKPGTDASFLEIGSEIARGVMSELKSVDTMGKQFVVAPFVVTGQSADDAKLMSDVLAPLYGRLAVSRPGEAAVNTKPLPAFTDAALTQLGEQLAASYVLGTQLLQENGAAQLDARLIKVADGSVAWSARYPLAEKDPTALGNEIANAALAAVPAK